MSAQSLLIDTNVIIGLEDDHTVQPVFASLLSTAAKHKVDVLVHEAARDDLARDKNEARRKVSLSKLDKFQILKKVRGLDQAQLEQEFGALNKHNDVVDATLLDALVRGAANILVTEDRGLHERARKHSAQLGRRVLFVADAVQLLNTTYEPVDAPVKYVEEVCANEIPLDDTIFDSLREGYPEFDDWWREKCVAKRRQCWIVDDAGTMAALVVRKDETAANTDATQKLSKILKICTFKVRPEKRGIKMGELLLRKIFWFAQANAYDLAYITTFVDQAALIDLLKYYGFQHTATKENGERIYEKRFSQSQLDPTPEVSDYDVCRFNYPRFIAAEHTQAFGVPIKENYHDTLYPDLKALEPQADLFDAQSAKRPGNTIRKVYLCRAASNLGDPGSLLFFYKGKSKHEPSQAFTAVGVFEECALAESTEDLMRLTGGRSVYSEADLANWEATPERPVKVINYLLSCYVDPPLLLANLKSLEIVGNHPPQSIFQIKPKQLASLLASINLGFEL